MPEKIILEEKVSKKQKPPPGMSAALGGTASYEPVIFQDIEAWSGQAGKEPGWPRHRPTGTFMLVAQPCSTR